MIIYTFKNIRAGRTSYFSYNLFLFLPGEGGGWYFTFEYVINVVLMVWFVVLFRFTRNVFFVSRLLLEFFILLRLLLLVGYGWVYMWVMFCLVLCRSLVCSLKLILCPFQCSFLWKKKDFLSYLILSYHTHTHTDT